MRLGLKVLMVLGLTLAILVPILMIRDVIGERQRYRDEAVRSVARSSAGAQGVLGPVLVVPYRIIGQADEKDDAGVVRKSLKTRSGQWSFFPVNVDMQGRLRPATRKLGLHEVRVYELDARLAAHFDVVIPASAPGGAQLQIDEPYLAYAFDDVRGLGGTPRLIVDGRPMKLEQGAGSGGHGGVHARLAVPRAGSRLQLDSSFQFVLAGTETLAVVPLGDRNRIAIESTWQHPQFNGAFLPRQRTVGANGFKASWEVSSLATSAQAQYGERARHGSNTGPAKANPATGGLDAIGISLVEPVNIYSQADRASKYGLLFVGLTFIGFFMFELIKQLRVHPLQYLLVGLALATFFLLLVALSEHLAFGWAYLVASVACIGLLGFYLSFVLHSWKRGAGFAVALATLYAALYGLLISEDNALVLGAGLLFVILASIMVVTRKVDWYHVASLPQRGAGGATYSGN